MPLLMLVVIEDEMPGANSDIALLTFERAPQLKNLIELDGGHFGLLYCPGALFTQASSVQREFLLENL